MDLRSVLRNYVRKNKAVVENIRHHEGENLPKKSKENVVAAETDVVLPETHEAEIKRRRYTAYMSDLGKKYNNFFFENPTYIYSDGST